MPGRPPDRGDQGFCPGSQRLVPRRATTGSDAPELSSAASSLAEITLPRSITRQLVPADSIPNARVAATRAARDGVIVSLPETSAAPRVSTSTDGSRPATGRRPARCTRSSSAKKRSEEHTSELQSLRHLVCRLLL